VKPINVYQARILRTKINAAKAMIFRMQDDLAKLAIAGVICSRTKALAEDFARARGALEDADNACIGVEEDTDDRETIARPRFR